MSNEGGTGVADTTASAAGPSGGGNANDANNKGNNGNKNKNGERDVGHYVVTAHRPGSVVFAERCSFLGPDTIDVVIARACRLEVRSLARGDSPGDVDMDVDGMSSSPPGASSSPFPVVLDLPIRGRISTLLSFRPPNAPSDLLFFSTERHKYAVISYDPVGQTTVTHCTGSLNDLAGAVTGREAQCGPTAAVDPLNRCIAVHLYDGYVKVLPILPYRSSASPRGGKSATGGGGGGKSGGGGGGRGRGGGGGAGPSPPRVLGDPFNLRMDQHTLQSMTFLDAVRDDYDDDDDVAGIGAAVKSKAVDVTSHPRLVMVNLDSRGVQHVVTYCIDLAGRDMVQCHRQGGGGAAGGAPSPSPQPPLGPKKSRVDAGSGMIIRVPLSRPAPAVAVAAGAKAKASSSGDGASYSASGSAGSTRRALEGGGIVLVGQDQLTYMNQYGGGMKVLPIEHTIMICYCAVPVGGGGGSDRRFLLGDDRGYLYVLALTLDGGIVTSLTMETLGTNISIPSAVNYLDDGLVFVGSQFGDSQLVRLLPERDVETRSYVEVLEEYTNLGPIGDFDLLDLDGKGQSQVVTCSGTARDGSIRVVRNGIGIHEQADVEIPGIKGMWNLRPTYDSPYDKYLVQSFIHETRILAITDDEMEETSIPGFQPDAATLYAGNVVQNCFVQVTEGRVNLVDCSTLRALDSWVPSNGERITVASGNDSGQVVVALRGGVLVSLSVVASDGGAAAGSYALSVRATTKLDQEVSCVNLNPYDDHRSRVSLASSSGGKKAGDDCEAMELDGSPPTRHDNNSGASRSGYVAVGLWNDFTVRILGMEDDPSSSSDDCNLAEVLRIDLGGDTQARSLLMATLEGNQPMLLVGLGDGQLISYFLHRDGDGEGGDEVGPGHCSGTTKKVDDDSTDVVMSTKSVRVTSRKKVSLGTQSISLSTFRNASNGNTCVFASGDRPTVIYMSSGKVLYSNINLSSAGTAASGAGEEVVNWVCPFHCELFPDCLCLASEESLRIGTIDDIQKLHVQTWRLGETPRRIAHHRRGRMFVVGCISGMSGDEGVGGDANMGNTVRFLDDSTFEEIHRIDLDPFEMVLSLISCNLENSSVSHNKDDESGTAASSTAVAQRQQAAKAGRGSYIVVGTAYAYPDEDEPTKGRILVFETNSPHDGSVGLDGNGGEDVNNASSNNNPSLIARSVRQLTEHHTKGGVYSLCPFGNGALLATVNSKTNLYRWHDIDGVAELRDDPGCHHGHILSLVVKSRGGGGGGGNKNLAIVGDIMRSISVLQYHEGDLIEIARDYNANWTTAVEMLSDEVYLGAENWNNLFTLRRNVDSSLEEVRCRLETQGEYYLGEMVNKFAGGSLVMPTGDVDGSGQGVAVGSQTLYGTVDGSIGVVLGLDRSNFAFFRSLERSMAAEVPGVGGLSHEEFRAFVAERRVHPSQGFVDGDMVESFLDLTRNQMENVVDRMNADGGWDLPDYSAVIMTEESEKASMLTVEDVLTKVEEMSRLH